MPGARKEATKTSSNGAPQLAHCIGALLFRARTESPICACRPRPPQTPNAAAAPKIRTRIFYKKILCPLQKFSQLLGIRHHLNFPMSGATPILVSVLKNACNTPPPHFCPPSPSEKAENVTPVGAHNFRIFARTRNPKYLSPRPYLCPPPPFSFFALGLAPAGGGICFRAAPSAPHSAACF